MKNVISPGSSILVIDDNAVILVVVRRILEDKYSVHVASSAKEAYIIMEEMTPDLILLDLEMPEIDGFGFLEILRNNPKWDDIPVLFLTGIYDSKREQKALEMGAAEYIQKPIVDGILLKRVQFHLELQQYRKKLEEMVTSRTEELLKTQEELRITAETAKEALQIKSSFHANMSHEIRTPLNSIMGFSEMALANATSKESEEYILKTKESTVLLLRLINDILDISKIEAGKMEIENISFCPGNVISSCQKMISPQIVEKGLSFTVNADDFIKKQHMLGDPVRLYQAILNLLSNAVKFTWNGNIILTALVTGMADGKAILRFIVEDSGIGISEAQMTRIFEPFVQINVERSDIREGNGLGLSIAKGIVEMMGGELTVESKLGIGSKFTIEIAFEVTESESLFDVVFGESDPGNIEKPQFCGDVLVCEDNMYNQQVIAEHLKRVGLTCVIAGNGLEGLNIVIERVKKKMKPFDIILMDLHMPVMDGFEATARINALGMGTPIIALTTNIITSDINDYKRSGLMDCLVKPFQTWDLWRCLLSFLTPDTKKPTVEEPVETSAKIKRGVLIVDDEKSNIMTLSHYLRDEYSIYVTRDSGKES